MEEKEILKIMKSTIRQLLTEKYSNPAIEETRYLSKVTLCRRIGLKLTPENFEIGFRILLSKLYLVKYRGETYQILRFREPGYYVPYQEALKTHNDNVQELLVIWKLLIREYIHKKYKDTYDSPTQRLYISKPFFNKRVKGTSEPMLIITSLKKAGVIKNAIYSTYEVLNFKGLQEEMKDIKLGYSSDGPVVIQ